MSELDEVVTQPEVDVEAVTGEGTDTPVPDPQPEPFLRVNDRTVYKTQEDAVKAYSEAGNRIKELSAWEKEMKQYGIKDPQTASALLNELRQLRSQQEEAKKAASTPKAEATNLTKEEREVRDYLKKVNPELGFVTKDDIKALQDELASMKQERASSTENEFKSAVEEGKAKVSSWMSEAKISDPDGEKIAVVESLIRDWVNSDDERVARFYQSSYSREKLLREGYDRAVNVIGWKGEATTPPSTASYAATKGKQVVVNKTLPKDGAAAKGGSQPKQANPRDRISALGDKAWEHFENSGKRA